MRIKTGSYSRAVTKAQDDKQAVVGQCREIAASKGLVILVKQDYLGRWQGWCKRHNARGASHPGDYQFLPTGRRAKKRDAKTPGGRVYLSLDERHNEKGMLVEVVGLSSADV